MPISPIARKSLFSLLVPLIINMVGCAEPSRPDLPMPERVPKTDRIAHRPQQPTPVPRTIKPKPKTSAHSGRLKVHRRAEWKARPINPSKAVAMGRIHRITVHHSGEKRFQPINNKSEATQRMRAYQSSHMSQSGWADIGYHFVIDSQGRIWEGRELRWQGAHAGNYAANQGNVGVSIMGNFDHSRPSTPQLKALQELLKELMRKHSVARHAIYTHQEIKELHNLDATACPGRHLQGEVNKLRRSLR